MYLQDYAFPSHLKPASTQYKVFYNVWTNYLLSFSTQLFSWEGLPDTIPGHEIEVMLMLYGVCGCFRNGDQRRNDLIVAPISRSGVTDYIDEFRTMQFSTPLHNGQRYININSVEIKNNKLHMPLYNLIHATAAKLAHTDTSYICGNVNGRNTVAWTAISGKYANDAEDFMRKQYNGIPSALIDKGFSTVESRDMHTQNNLNVRELLDSQDRILSQFYEMIGVRKVNEKRERMVEAETSSNSSLLHLNIDNMLQSRQEAAAQINAMFQQNITVRCNVDIDGNINTENRRQVKTNDRTVTD